MSEKIICVHCGCDCTWSFTYDAAIEKYLCKNCEPKFLRTQEFLNGIMQHNQKLQAENEKLKKVVEAAKGYMLGHREDCAFFGIISNKCDCGFKELEQALKELEGE